MIRVFSGIWETDHLERQLNRLETGETKNFEVISVVYVPRKGYQIIAREK